MEKLKGVSLLKIGSKFCGHHILEDLGKGAESLLYLVQEPKTKQILALKHVKLHGPKSQRFIDQVAREHEVGQKLSHPNLRKPIRLIRHRSFLKINAVSLLLEFIDGTTIDGDRPSSIIDCVRIFKNTAEAIEHMHDKGFIHCDLKPNNIIFDGSRVRVIDLGQACKSGTVKPRIQGTPGYMAPEQAHLREVTEKTDIYNFGATMHWILLGQTIPTAMEPGSTSPIPDDRICLPERPHLVDARIPEALSELLMRCIQVHPTERASSMNYVKKVLSEILKRLEKIDNLEASSTI